MKDLAPLYNLIKRFSKKEHVSFYMPGHKQGKAYSKSMKEDVFKLDVTELKYTDDLHNPKKEIKETFIELAKTYSAIGSFLLVNGSTGGVHAMIMATCKSGDTIIVDRSCHRSVINACTIFGLKPVFISQDIIPEFGIYTPVSIDNLKEVINKHPKAKAVFITSPSYYGICSNIKEISKLAHDNNMILLIDEAHGAHFAFSDKLPRGSIEQGADMCVQSSHKTLPAPTQTAFLHVGSKRVDINKVKQCVSMLETSSPSRILMCYADLGHGLMKNNGKEVMDKLILDVNLLKDNLSSKTNLKFIDKTLIEDSAYDVDSLRLVINFSKYNITGYKAEEWLTNKYGIMAEMADLYNVVCIVTYGNRKEDIKKLERALLDIVKKLKPNKKEIFIPELPKNDFIIEPHKAFNMEGEYVKLEDGVNRISKVCVNVYPPGACAISIGEKITEEVISYLESMKRAGANIVGIEEGKIMVVKKDT